MSNIFRIWLSFTYLGSSPQALLKNADGYGKNLTTELHDFQ